VRKILAGLVGAGLALTLAACGSDDVAADSVYANQGVTIGIAMPNQTSSRWVSDGEAMVDQFTAMGYKADLVYADDDVDKQNQQVQSMVDNGDALVVISAVDGGGMADTLANAAAKDIPVLAYDRLLTDTENVDYQATFDNVRVGTMQADYIVNQLNLDADDGATYNIELFAGSKTDINAKYFYNGSMQVLRPYINSGKLVVRSGETKFKDMFTENYSGDVAAERMTKILNKSYTDATLDAVLSPYDGMTIGIINALKEAGYGTADKPLPVNTGQDSELASVKSIIAGEQDETIFKDTRELAKVAVEQANAILTGTDPMVNDTDTFDNGVKVVPTYLLYPVEVVKANYKTLLVDSGYIEAADLVS